MKQTQTTHLQRFNRQTMELLWWPSIPLHV
jgi:hypothetical protein